MGPFSICVATRFLLAKKISDLGPSVLPDAIDPGGAQKEWKRRSRIGKKNWARPGRTRRVAQLGRSLLREVHAAEKGSPLVLDHDEVTVEPNPALSVGDCVSDPNPIPSFGKDHHPASGRNHLDWRNRVARLAVHPHLFGSINGIAVLHPEDLGRRPLGAQALAL